MALSLRLVISVEVIVEEVSLALIVGKSEALLEALLEAGRTRRRAPPPRAKTETEDH